MLGEEVSIEYVDYERFLRMAIVVSLLTVVIINAHNALRVITKAAMMEE